MFSFISSRARHGALVLIFSMMFYSGVRCTTVLDSTESSKKRDVQNSEPAYSHVNKLSSPRSSAGKTYSFIIPQDDRVHVTFLERSELGNVEKLHGRLLTLYERVMDKVIKMDKLEERVETILNKLSGVDQLNNTVNALKDKFLEGNRTFLVPKTVSTSPDIDSAPKDQALLPDPEVQQELNDLATTLARVREEINVQHLMLQKQNDKASNTSRLLAKQNDVLEQKALELKTQKNTIDLLRAKIKNIESYMETRLLEERLLTRNRTQKAVFDEHKQFHHLQQELSKIRNKYETLHDRVEKIKEEANRNEKLQNDSERKLNMLHQDFVTLRTTVSGLANGHMKAIEQRLLHLESGVENWSHWFRVVNTTCRSVKSDNSAIHSAVDGLSSELGKYKLRLSKQDASIRHFQAHQQDMIARYDNNKKERREMRERLDKLDINTSHVKDTVTGHLSRCGCPPLPGDSRLQGSDEITEIPDVTNSRYNQTVETSTVYGDLDFNMTSRRDRARRQESGLKTSVEESFTTVGHVTTQVTEAETSDEHESSTSSQMTSDLTQNINDTFYDQEEGSSEEPTVASPDDSDVTTERVASNSPENIRQPTRYAIVDTDSADIGYVTTERMTTSQTTSSSTSCNLTGVGDPVFVRTVRKQFTGAWMMDSGSAEEKVWLLKDNVNVKTAEEYTNMDKLQTGLSPRIHHLTIKCQGTGHVIYKGRLYCNRAKSKRLYRYDLKTGEVVSKRLRKAGASNTQKYAFAGYTDIDFAVDERGLWVVFAGEKSKGAIIIGKMDPETLRLDRKWQTNYLKVNASESFMVCGVLYVVAEQENAAPSIVYAFDTKTGQEIRPPKGTFAPEHHVMMDYNPVSRELFAWDISDTYDGKLLKYPLIFSKEP